MNSDSHFLIGYSHHICEDYALSGNYNDICYGIVADGCSSSKDVDIGARILAKTAESYIKLLYHYSWDAFGKLIIWDAQKTIKSLGIQNTSLDSTLIILVGNEKSNKFQIYAYGDGIVSYYDEQNKLHIVDIEYKSGAPHYLSYNLDEDRRLGYKEQFGGNLVISHYDCESSELYSVYSNSISYNNEVHLQFENSSYISIMSDGVKSFYNSFERINMIKEFMAFKNNNGDFVKRRMNAIKRQCDKNGIKYHDDISMASIYLG